MYQLTSTLTLSSRVGAQWVTVDAGSRIVSELFASYRKIILTLTVTPGDSVIYVDMDQLKAEFSHYTNTLSVLLLSIEGRGLDTLPSLPNSKVKYVKYSNALYAGYHLRYGKSSYHLPIGTPDDMKPDVQIYREEAFDHGDLHKYCLVTVNGYVHQTEVNNGDAYILDAGTNMRLANDNHAGILSFFEMGELSRVKITPEMIAYPEGFTTLKDRVRLNIPEGYENKACFLVLGGYLVFLQKDAFYKVTDQAYHVDLKRLAYVDRLLESMLYLDLGHLELSQSQINEGNLNLEEVWSDAVIRRYFTMSQSFLVFVDADQLFFDRITLRQMKSPGYFTAYQEPIYPLFLGTGRMADYWKVQEGDRWSVKVTDSYRRMWMHHRENETRLQNIFGQLSFDAPYYFSQGFLMEIGSYSDEA